MLDLAKVADVHPESNAVDLVFMMDNRRISGVQVMCDMAGTDFGSAGFAEPDAVGYDAPMTKTRDLIAVVGWFRDGSPMVLGFVFPQIAQCLFKDKNRMVWRSPSDVYFTVDGSGNAEVFHPSGAYIRMGTSPAHEDLTGRDYDGIWAIKRNTGNAVHIHLAQAGGNATFDIAPDGSIVGTSAVKFDFTAPDIKLNGATTINGETTINGAVNQSGGDAVFAQHVTATMGLRAAGIDTESHTHTSTEVGTETSGPHG